MQPELTVNKMAARLADETGTPIPALARKIRHWSQNGLFGITSSRGEGPTAAMIYSEVHLAAARIFVVLSNMNWHVGQIAGVSKHLRNIAHDDATRENAIGFGRLWSSGLDAVVDAAKRGDRDWILSIYVTEDGAVKGGVFARKADQVELFQGLGLITITLPVGTMLAPLFAGTTAQDSRERSFPPCQAATNDG